jgi:hypothetical protein
MTILIFTHFVGKNVAIENGFHATDPCGYGIMAALW